MGCTDLRQVKVSVTPRDYQKPKWMHHRNVQPYPRAHAISAKEMPVDPAVPSNIVPPSRNLESAMGGAKGDVSIYNYFYITSGGKCIKIV